MNRYPSIIIVVTQGYWFRFFSLNLSECEETVFFIENLILNRYPLIWDYKNSVCNMPKNLVN